MEHLRRDTRQEVCLRCSVRWYPQPAYSLRGGHGIVAYAERLRKPGTKYCTGRTHSANSRLLRIFFCSTNVCVRKAFPSEFWGGNSAIFIQLHF